MIDLALITSDDFRARFRRDFLYLPIYTLDGDYCTGDVVYYAETLKFYKAKVDNPVALPSNDWELVKEHVDDYISEADLEVARIKAIGDYHSSAFSRDSVDFQKEAYLLLWAFYLVSNVQASEAGLDSKGGMIASKSLDGVSVSYSDTDDVSYGYLSQNHYGRSYIQLLDPRISISHIQVASVY